jgi:type VI secretion system secreted protein Hcp
MPGPSAADLGALGGGACDAFLHVTTKRAGKIRGESITPGHLLAIVVSGWHWGLTAGSAVGSNQATARRSYTAFTVTKSIDMATTPLMSALASNDEVKEAVLLLRRPGGLQDVFFTITLRQGRITGVEHQFDKTGAATETVTFTFTDVEVEYRPQLASGIRAGTFSFTDTIAAVG